MHRLLLMALPLVVSAGAPFRLAYDVKVSTSAGNVVVQGDRVYLTAKGPRLTRLDARDLRTGRYVWSAITGGTQTPGRRATAPR